MDTSRRFNLISWGATVLVVCGLVGFVSWRLAVEYADAFTARFDGKTATNQLPAQGALPTPEAINGDHAIKRALELKTNIPERPRFDVIKHTVERGDSIFEIAHDNAIKPETLLWANYDVLQDNPDSLRIGQVLNVPPTDGVYYQWKAGDTLDQVAKEFKANAEDILEWPGNHLDLTDPVFRTGQWVMVPGGQREFKQWIIPTVARGSSGTAGVKGSSCGGGSVGSGAFVWPSDNHYLSGNDYYSGHLGIDIAAGEGAAIYAADSGVVTMAASGWNYGYGNVIMIDHGNGYVTLYAHLSQINVTSCQSVFAHQLIGLAGATGNAFGPHLHFEVRLNGGFVNPWYVLPAP
jgi:murein DD-endopeptidase MepM/ murein hydrolase activator NlpD